MSIKSKETSKQRNQNRGKGQTKKEPLDNPEPQTIEYSRNQERENESFDRKFKVQEKGKEQRQGLGRVEISRTSEITIRQLLHSSRLFRKTDKLKIRERRGAGKCGKVESGRVSRTVMMLSGSLGVTPTMPVLGVRVTQTRLGREGKSDIEKEEEEEEGSSTWAISSLRFLDIV